MTPAAPPSTNPGVFWWLELKPCFLIRYFKPSKRGHVSAARYAGLRWSKMASRTAVLAWATRNLPDDPMEPPGDAPGHDRQDLGILPWSSLILLLRCLDIARLTVRGTPRLAIINEPDVLSANFLCLHEILLPILFSTFAPPPKGFSRNRDGRWRNLVLPLFSLGGSSSRNQ